MPIMKCTRRGRSGWKFGEMGACFIGPGARDKAAKQAAAIGASRARAKDAKKAK